MNCSVPAPGATGDTVAVKVTGWPLAEGFWPLATTVEVAALVTEWVATGVAALMAKSVSPVYVAVMDLGPTVAEARSQAPVPRLSVTVQVAPEPSATSTEPVGVPPVEVTLTSDGRHYNRQGWHEGPTAEDIRVERWTPQGMVFHGYLDSVSRKLVQAG